MAAAFTVKRGTAGVATADDVKAAINNIEALWRGKGVQKADAVTVYCQVGIRASHDVFTLALLGHDLTKLKNYYGAWEEWRNREDTPIRTNGQVTVVNTPELGVPLPLDRGPVPRGPLAAIVLVQVALLSIGVSREYRLKHEDNNAMHTTFARSHLQRGLAVTRAQNFYSDKAKTGGSFYPNHPPAAAWLLAGAFAATGHDGPVTTRTTAIALHLVGTWLFFGLARRLLADPRDVLIAMLFYSVAPMGAFFGRMLNHEVLVVPPALLLVRGYLARLDGSWSDARASMAMAVGTVAAALVAWAGFFVIGACAVHALGEARGRRNPRAWAPAVGLGLGGLVLGLLVMAHLMWVQGGDLSYFGRLLAVRMGAESINGPVEWLGRIVELHWRYFGLTSVVGLGIVAWRTADGWRRMASRDPAVEVAAIFLAAGAGYVAAFNFHSTAHDYWQFPLLPASAVAFALVTRHIRAALGTGLHAARWRALAALVLLDMATTSTVTLVRNHGKASGYCLEAVAWFEANFL